MVSKIVILQCTPEGYIVIVSSPAVLTPLGETVQVFPNLASEEVNIALSASLSTSASWQLFNQIGQPVSQVTLAPGQQEVQVELEGLWAGLYFWQMKLQGRRVANGKLIILK